MHCAQQRDNRSQNGNQEGHGCAAAPAKQNRNAAAKNTAGFSASAPCVQLCQHICAIEEVHTLHNQMVNRTAEQNKQDCANGSHPQCRFSSKNMDNSQVQQGGYSKEEPRLSQQTQKDGLHKHQKRAFRVNANHQEQDKQQEANNRRQYTRGNWLVILCADFGCFLYRLRCFFRGRFFRGGIGRHLLFHMIHSPFRLAGRLFIGHDIPPYAIKFKTKVNMASPQQ